MHAAAEEEKGHAELSIETLKLKLTRAQFKFVARLFEKMERIKRKARFTKFRPKESVKENPSAWWNFAFKTVKQQYDIDQKVELFNRQYIQKYCLWRSEYRKIYEKKLKNEHFSEQSLDHLESNLDISSLIEIREAVKLKMRQKPKSTGWFGGWFGGGSSTSMVDVQDDLEISQEDKRRLQQLVEDNENIVVSGVDRPGITKHSLHISLPLLCIEADEYLSVQFHDSIINYNSIPGSKASSFELVTQKFEVHNLQDTSELIITSQKKSESDVFFKMLFQINPFDPRNMSKIADQSIDVVSGGVDININHKLLKDVQMAFKVPEEANLIEFSTALQQEYVQRYAQTRAGLAHIVSTRNIFLIRLDMNAPRIKIPGFGEEAIVMNFGRLEIETNKSKIHSTTEFDQSKLEIDELESMAYANYDIKLENLEIQVLKSSNDVDLDLSRHVLEPLSINWRLERLDTKAQNTAELPKYKIEGEIEFLKFDISNYRVVQALTVFEYANSIWSEPINLDDFTPTTSELLVLPSAPAYVPSTRSNAQLDMVDSVYLFDTNLFTIDEAPSDENFYDAKDTFSGSNVVSETASKYSASSALDAIQIAIRMKIHKVEASVYDEISDNLTNQSRILLLETGALQFSQKVRKYQNEIKGFCRYFALIYRPDAQVERMTLVESGAKKIELTDTTTENTLQIPGVRNNRSILEMENSAIWFELLEDRRVDITESDLIVNTAAFESSVDTVCIGKIMRFLNSMKPKRANISVIEDSDISTDDSSPQSSSSSSHLNHVNVKNITIKSKSAKLNLLSYYRTVSIFEMSGTEIGFCIKKNENIVRLKVAKVSLEDPNKPHPYCHVISVADTSSTFFELEMKLFDLTKEENEDLNFFNGELTVRAGALNINFFYVFMDHLAFKYPEELQEALYSFDEFDTLRQNATGVNQKTSLESKYENPKRYKLDVRMDAPKIFIPESPISNVGLKADLGSLVVDNTITNYVTSNPNITSAPVKDTVIVKLEDFRLIKIANSEKPADPENVEIFYQKSLTIKVERNLSLNWYFDAPGMALFFEIPKISMALGKADLEIFWTTLYGNLMGRFSKFEFLRHVPPSRVPSEGTDNFSFMGAENFDESPTEQGRITVTDPTGITINLPGVSAGGNSNQLEVPDRPSLTSTLTDENQPEDFDTMTVSFKMSEVKLTIYRDKIHSNELAQATMSGLKGTYCMQNNQEMTVYLSINDLLTSDTRSEKPSSVPTYLVQKQADENQELMNLTYSSFPQGEDRSKQIISQKIQSMQIILILDLVSQITDIFVGSMPTDTSQKRSYGAEMGKEFVNRISSTMESDSKSHLQFYLEMQKPNILMVDLTKREPSAIKIQTEVKMNYIASMQEQNLDLSILDTEVSCVPFKWCFNADSIHYGQIVIDGIDLDLNTQFSKEYTRGRLKMSDFEIILTPAVISTILLAYQYLLSGDENVESSSSKSSETVYVPIGCQNVVDPSKIWFLPNPTGSNVDEAVPGEAEIAVENEEEHEEQFTIEIPNASIKFETQAFYGRSANTVSLPLLLFRTKGNIEIQNWSSEMKADMNLKLIGDVFHEARPGYEKLIEPLEYSTARTEEDFQWFELECRYRNYNRSIKQHISDFGEDDFEHTEKLPKQKLTLKTSNSFNLNISAETIHVFNHWQSSFSESFTELEKTSSLTNQAPSPQNSIISNTKSIDHEVKAPITIFNMTDHDIVLKASSNWKDFDPSIGRAGGVSPKTSNLLFPDRERRANVLCNQSSLLLPEDKNATTDGNLYNLGSVPLHFQLDDPNMRKSVYRRSVHKTNFYRVEQQIISICPNGFTKRQIDVSSPSEIPVEFVSNTNPNLRITLIVHVEGIAGVRKISIRTNISIVNHLPLPLEISSLADSTLGSLVDFSLDPTKTFFIPDSDELEINRGRNISVPISVLNQSFKFAVKLADPNVSTSLKPIDYSRFYSKNYNGEPIIERLEFNTKDQSGLKYYANIVINAYKLSRSSGNSATFAKIEISVKPCFAVRNWLPFPIRRVF